jgi:hypothetical protein
MALPHAVKERNEAIAARNEVLQKLLPLITRTCENKLRDKMRQERESAIQETALKLCTPSILQGWLTSPRRTWFCHWLSRVTFTTAIDVIREVNTVIDWKPIEELPLPGMPLSPTSCDELRKCMITALSRFEIDSQLVFYMKWGCFQCKGVTIAKALHVSESLISLILQRTINYIKSHLVAHFAIADTSLVGTRHPIEGFENIEGKGQRQINDGIVDLVMVRPRDQQFAFYATYSPLSVSPAEVVAILQEESTRLPTAGSKQPLINAQQQSRIADENTVRTWLADINLEIKSLIPPMRSVATASCQASIEVSDAENQGIERAELPRDP